MEAITALRMLLMAPAIAMSVVTAAGQPAPQPATKAAPRSAPMLSAAAVARLVEVGAESDSFTYDTLGIHKIEDGTSYIAIATARQQIMFNAREAAAKGGKYTPPPASRLDVAIVSCGDSDLGDRWDCARLSVLDSLGRRVAPLTYRAGPDTYRNGFGATWTARTVIATYQMADLAKGFTVRAAGTDGVEFTELVSQGQFELDLFWTLPLNAAERRAADEAAKRDAAAKLAAEPEPPMLFRGTLEESAGDRWVVTSSAPNYTWLNCELVSGSASAPLPPLEPGKPVSAPRPKGGLPGLRPSVQCVAKARRYEGPVPEFVVSVQRDGGAAFVIKNETNWAWTHCAIQSGASLADAVPLMPNGQVRVRVTDFDPPLASPGAALAMEVSCVTNGQRVKAVQSTGSSGAATGPLPPTSELAISVERRAADFWIVRNLTALNWKACEATVGQKFAEIVAFNGNAVITLTGGNFRPGPPRADEAATVEALSLFCISDGVRVNAVRKPTK